MEIKSITINAESSKNYQKYCFSITAENITEADVETLKNVAIKESIKGINELAGSIGEAKTTVSTNPGISTAAPADLVVVKMIFLLSCSFLVSLSDIEVKTPTSPTSSG